MRHGIHYHTCFEKLANIDVPQRGVVMLEFSLENLYKQKLEVPLLVTNEDIGNQVVGYVEYRISFNKCQALNKCHTFGYPH